MKNYDKKNLGQKRLDILLNKTTKRIINNYSNNNNSLHKALNTNNNLQINNIEKLNSKKTTDNINLCLETYIIKLLKHLHSKPQKVIKLILKLLKDNNKNNLDKNLKNEESYSNVKNNINYFELNSLQYYDILLRIGSIDYNVNNTLSTSYFNELSEMYQLIISILNNKDNLSIDSNITYNDIDCNSTKYREDKYDKRTNSKFLEIIKIPFVLLPKLNTDDCYVFSKCIKEIDELLNNSNPINELINDYHIFYNEYKSLCSNSPILYDKNCLNINIANSKQIDSSISNHDSSENNLLFTNVRILKLIMISDDILCNLLLKDYIINCYKFIQTKINQAWAKPIIKQTLKNAIIQKNKFLSKQVDEIVFLINLETSDSLIHNEKHKIIEDKIMSNPVDSYYKFSDSRKEVIVDNSNKWINKQLGLNLKLDIV